MDEFTYAQNRETRIFYNLGENSFQRELNRKFLKEEFGVNQLFFYTNDSLNKICQRKAQSIPKTFGKKYDEFLAREISRNPREEKKLKEEVKKPLYISRKTFTHLNDLKRILNEKGLKDLNDDEVVSFSLRLAFVIEETKF